MKRHPKPAGIRFISAVMQHCQVPQQMQETPSEMIRYALVIVVVWLVWFELVFRFQSPTAHNNTPLWSSLVGAYLFSSLRIFCGDVNGPSQHTLKSHESREKSVRAEVRAGPVSAPNWGKMRCTWAVGCSLFEAQCECVWSVLFVFVRVFTVRNGAHLE